GLQAWADRVDLGLLQAVSGEGLRGCARDPALGPRDEPGQPVHPLHRRVHGGAARPRRRSARRARRSPRGLARLQGARGERRGSRDDSRRSSLRVDRVLNGHGFEVGWLPASLRISWVSSRICFDRSISVTFWPSSSCTVRLCRFATTWCFASDRFWLISTNVERKIASSETIIVSSPYG